MGYFLPMAIDVEMNRKFLFGIDLNKILPDLLKLNKEDKEAWHTIFTTYISKNGQKAQSGSKFCSWLMFS